MPAALTRWELWRMVTAFTRHLRVRVEADLNVAGTLAAYVMERAIGAAIRKNIDNSRKTAYTIQEYGVVYLAKILSRSA